MKTMVLVLCFLFGAAMGSFLCCQARRLRRKEKGQKKLGKWSVCLECGHRLAWYENLPIISWVLQKGRCRKCGKKIGIAEVLAEVLTGMAFLAVGIYFDCDGAGILEWCEFGMMLALMIGLAFLAIYDGLYGELPVAVLTISGFCAIMVVILRLWSLFSRSQFSWIAVVETVGAGVLLGGVYLVLYLISKGKWVGDGDYILAAIVGLVAGSPFRALVVLCVANTLATVVMAPVVMKKKNKKIFFGPFLVAALVITLVFYDIIRL